MRFAATALAIVCATAHLLTPVSAQRPNNQFGAHLLVDNLDARGRAQLSWAKALVGPGGYIKTMFYMITKDTAGASDGWKAFVSGCYGQDLIPVVRLGGVHSGEKGYWIKPEADADGSYGSIAAAVKRVVSELPRSEKYPLYIEVWNEPNLSVEWSGKPDLREYARFFVEVSKAIRSIGDPRIKILNGAFGLSAESTEECIKAHPDFINAFDVWASHPYPQNHPPEYNIIEKTAKYPDATIDGYRTEVAVLEKYGRKNVQVMITETGYPLGNGVYATEGYEPVNEYNRADYMLRAFRDYYPKWPEVLAVFPFLFSSEGWEAFNWVRLDSGTDASGLPTKPHYQYEVVRKLAKPTEQVCSISGKLTDEKFGIVLAGAEVALSPGDLAAKTDPMGNFIFGGLAPGSYSLSAKASGFETAEATLAAEAGTNVRSDHRLKANATGSISGVVVDGRTERPLPGVSVNVQPGDQKLESDEQGRFVLRDLPAVTFDLTAAKPGYTSHELEGVAVLPGKSEQVTLRIAEDRGGPEPNLLVNPGFERVSDPAAGTGSALVWETLVPGPAEVSTQVRRSGIRSQMVKASGAENAIRQITHYGTAKPGKSYTAGVWAKSAELEGGEAWLTLTFTDNGGGVLLEAPVSKKLTGSSSWTYLNVSGVAPAKSERVSVNLWVKARAGAAYFDDAYLGVTE